MDKLHISLVSGYVYDNDLNIVGKCFRDNEGATIMENLPTCLDGLKTRPTIRELIDSNLTMSNITDAILNRAMKPFGVRIAGLKQSQSLEEMSRRLRIVCYDYIIRATDYDQLVLSIIPIIERVNVEFMNAQEKLPILQTQILFT